MVNSNCINLVQIEITLSHFKIDILIFNQTEMYIFKNFSDREISFTVFSFNIQYGLMDHPKPDHILIGKQLINFLMPHCIGRLKELIKHICIIMLGIKSF